jgi:outer membrane lipoprotein-sorting protein
MYIKLSLTLFIITVSLFAQKPDPEVILENVKKEFEKIDDYQVNVRIKVDVEFLKMPERQAKIYYKKPDKLQIESDNFAMLPKSGLNFSPLGFLSYKYTAFYEKEDTINGRPVSVVKVIPIEANADVILSTFWIDTNRNLILKIESSRKPQGTFTIDLDYLKTKGNFWLPSSMVFTFSLEPGMLPGRIAEELYKGNKQDDVAKKGSVYLFYSDYKVNQGLPDSLFEQKDSKK